MYFIYEHLNNNNVPFYYGKGTISKSHSYKGYNRAYAKANRSLEWKEKYKEGLIVNIIEHSDNLDYILKKEEELFTNCKTCVNKQKNNNFSNYTLNKISQTIAELKILDRIWYISSDGKYFNSDMVELKLANNGRGYMMCKIYRKPVNKNIYIHKLVAQSFIPNPENKPQVNHIDGDKSNNRVDNLEWNTPIENNIHKVNIGNHIRRMGKPILQYTIEGKFIKEWGSIKEIKEYFKCSHSLVYLSIANNIKSALGFKWTFKENNNLINNK